MNVIQMGIIAIERYLDIILEKDYQKCHIAIMIVELVIKYSTSGGLSEEAREA